MVTAHSETRRALWGGWTTLALAIGLWIGLSALFWSFAWDDSFILFRYARNWAEGHHLVYNPGGVPVDGYTSFAWTMMLGGLGWLNMSRDFMEVAKVLGVVLGVATLVIVRRLPDFSEDPAPTRWVAVLLTATAPSLIVGAVDGLETSLYVFVQMAVVWRWLQDMRRGAPSLLLGVLGGLLTLVRPDGVLLLALLTLGTLWKRRLPGRPSFFACLLVGGGFALIVVPHLVWHLQTYGYLLPNTFYAKPGGHPDQFLKGLLGIGGVVKESGGWATMAVVVFALIGRDSPYQFALLAVIISRTAFNVWSGGEVMGHYRFLAPALPAYFLLFQMGIDRLVLGLSEVSLAWSRPWLRRFLQVAPLFVVAYMISGPLLQTLRESRAYLEALTRAHIRLGIDLRRDASAGARIAMGDAGAAPYFSGLYTIDILALNDRHLAHLPGRHFWKMDTDYVLGQRPAFVVVCGREMPEKGFTPVFPAEGILHAALIQSAAYALWRVYPFRERYVLWVYRRL